MWMNLHEYADHMHQHYDYAIEKLDAQRCNRSALRRITRAVCWIWGPRICILCGWRWGWHRRATAAGVRIFEDTRALHIEHGTRPIVHTQNGKITADHVVIAGNGYLGGLDKRVAARVMPINNFIAATEPLGDDAARVLARDVAVADSRFVVNYFRLSHDGRLLFGGGESYGYRFPTDIAAKVRKPMSQIFPHLKDVKIDYAWGGTLAITMKRLPYLSRLAPNVLSRVGVFRSRRRDSDPCGATDGACDHGTIRRF